MKLTKTDCHGEAGFWKRVVKTETCWLWTGRPNRYGYGRRTHLGRSQTAHRISWLFAFGPPPDDKLVLHTCDVRLCVNPAHLFLGTHNDNSDDKIRKQRHAYGSKNTMSKLTEADVLEMRLRYAAGASQSELAEAFGVRANNVSMVVNGRRWKHVAGPVAVVGGGA